LNVFFHLNKISLFLRLLHQKDREFQPHFATVENESHMHSSGRGADSHFKLVIVSDAFEGMRKVQRHQNFTNFLRMI